MKILKKAGAVLLALAMIAVMIPQLGSKVVKAAGTSYLYNNNKTPVKDAYFTAPSGLQANTSSKSKDFPNGGYKTNSGFGTGFSFTVGEGKYAVVEFNLNKKNTGDCAFWVNDKAGNKMGNDKITEYPDLKIQPTNGADAALDSEHFVLPAICSAGTYTITKDGGEVVLFQIKVTEYNDETEAQGIVDAYVKSITDKPKYTVSGKITSEVDLTDGIVSLSSTTPGAKAVDSKPITKNEDGTYNYVVEEVVGDGAVYNVSVKSQAIEQGKKNIDSTKLATVSFTLNQENKTDADFTINYKDIDNIWDFSNMADWTACEYNNVSEPITYKGLTLDLSAGGKFMTDAAKNCVQTNTGTKVKIPVSGLVGTVTCTFSDNVSNKITLGGVAGNSKTTITASYKGVDYVELVIGAASTYIKKIEVVPDTTPAVKTMGASVRQETAEWGNGIRFGGQLDLTKVDKDACESGTLIGLASTVGDGNEMTLENVGTTCINVVRTTYITETDATLEYAAALINIPETNLNTSIVARPYVIVNGTTYYGEQIATTYNSATKIVNGQ